jgi:hypothetical protein
MGEHGMPWSAPPAHRQTGLFQVSKGSPRSKSVKMLKEKCKLLGLLERIKKNEFVEWLEVEGSSPLFSGSEMTS